VRRRQRKSKYEILQELIAQQEKDAKSSYQYREIIIPLKYKPYQEIKDIRKRAIYILYKCGYSYRQIAMLFEYKKDKIAYIIKSCREKLENA